MSDPLSLITGTILFLTVLAFAALYCPDPGPTPITLEDDPCGR